MIASPCNCSVLTERSPRLMCRYLRMSMLPFGEEIKLVKLPPRAGAALISVNPTGCELPLRVESDPCGRVRSRTPGNDYAPSLDLKSRRPTGDVTLPGAILMFFQVDGKATELRQQSFFA